MFPCPFLSESFFFAGCFAAEHSFPVNLNLNCVVVGVVHYLALSLPALVDDGSLQLTQEDCMKFIAQRTDYEAVKSVFAGSAFALP